MILEAFLICALAAPAVPFKHSGSLPNPYVSFAHFLTNQQRMLLVGGEPGAVTIMRNVGLKAFGALTDDHPGVTPYHAVADPGKLPFKTGLFHAVYWSHKNSNQEVYYEALLDALRLIQADGLFLFDDDEYPYWPIFMKSRNWVQVPFRLGQFSIWERRDMPDIHKRQRGVTDGSNTTRTRVSPGIRRVEPGSTINRSRIATLCSA